jgi:hypothetical protein
MDRIFKFLSSVFGITPVAETTTGTTITSANFHILFSSIIIIIIIIIIIRP